MEQNTDRMWWTIGAVVLGGALMAALVLLLNTTLFPNIKTKFDVIDRSAVTMPNSNLLTGSTKYTIDNPKIVSSSDLDGWFTVNDVFVKNLKAGTYTMSGQSDALWTNHGTSDINRQGKKVGLWLMSTTPGLNVNISLGDTVPKTIEVPKDGDYCVRVNLYSNGTDVVTHRFWNFKLEEGSTAT